MLVQNKPRIGILALQGDYDSHRTTIEDVGGEAVLIKTPEAVAGVDALILPGRREHGHWEADGALWHRQRCFGGGGSRAAIYGTCAGMILLSKNIDSGAMRGGQPTLGLMDISVARNAFGRQVDSFETEIETAPEVLGDQDVRTLRGVFIRAPYITEAGPGVQILARCQGKIVLARQGNLLASAFHRNCSATHRSIVIFSTDRRQTISRLFTQSPID